MRKVSLFFFYLLLTSCGFSLRAPVQLADDIQTIAISPDDPYRPWQRTVRETLEFSGVNVTSDPAQSQMILKLSPEEVMRTTYAVDTAGDVAQELLTYIVEFEAVDQQENILIPKQTIKATRILYIHNNNLLSVNREQRTLTQDMRQEAALQLMRRLAAYQP